jgi:predicted transcriptional regulator
MNDTATAQDHDFTILTSQIVSCYLANNTIASGELAKLIAEVHGSLKGLQAAVAVYTPPELTPAVPAKKSVTPDYIVCLEDGKKFKALKRHLHSKFGLTPAVYRVKWGLPADYPMVAPNYAAARSAMAKSSGLGRKAQPVQEAKPARKKIGLKFT